LTKSDWLPKQKASTPQKSDMDTTGRNRWYFEASAETLRSAESTAILEQLAVHHLFDVGAKQRVSIPRMGKRADAVLLAGSIVFIMEYKVGASE